MVEIRPLATAEYERLCVCMPLRSRGRHWATLNRQQAGELLYLIAWEDERAVGQVSLFWRPMNDPYAMLADCPWIVDLLVHPQRRSRGTGTALLGACEEAARAHGATRIGLGVAVSNVGARALYDRLGYREAGLGEHLMTGMSQDASGQTHIWEDLVAYLVKPLVES